MPSRFADGLWQGYVVGSVGHPHNATPISLLNSHRTDLVVPGLLEWIQQEWPLLLRLPWATNDSMHTVRMRP